MTNVYHVVLFADLTDVLSMQKSLGPYKVADALRRAGYSVLVVNHLHIFSVDEIKEILAHSVNEHTLFVGINSFFYKLIDQPKILDTHQYEKGGIQYRDREMGAFLPHGIKYNQEIKTLIKQLNPDCKIVLGGPDAQDAEYTRDYDYVILGYADNSIVNLADHLSKESPLKHSRRSLHKNTIINDAIAEGYNFIGTKMHYADHDFVLPGETLVTEISRGCIFKCTFCSYPLNGKTKNDFVKLEEILFEEFVENYQRFNVTRYIFSDDTFNDTREKILMLHRISKRLPFQLEYWAYIRIDLLIAHPGTVDLLIESGLRAGHFGIESMNAESSKAIGKGGDRQKIIDMLAYIKSKYGDDITLSASFIFGLPYESVDSMTTTVNMLLDKTIQLDAWTIFPLHLSKHFLLKSELDTNYEKYGYVVEGDPVNFALPWKNQYTTYDQCKQLAEESRTKALLQGVIRINATERFHIASLGFDLEYTKGHNYLDFDWHSVDIKKQQRKKIYKQKIFDLLAISTPVV
jgi:radical SAM superfamily enzyme YgiQ (UPF0313 family)